MNTLLLVLLLVLTTPFGWVGILCCAFAVRLVVDAWRESP
jgi:hypothetical protein